MNKTYAAQSLQEPDGDRSPLCYRDVPLNAEWLEVSVEHPPFIWRERIAVIDDEGIEDSEGNEWTYDELCRGQFNVITSSGCRVPCWKDS